MPAQPRSDEANPKYQQVFDQLRSEIISGKYQPGEKLPSEAALVTRFGTSRITVGRAVGDLRREGLVERRAGSGTYIRDRRGPVLSSGLSFGLLIPDLGRTEIFEPICQGMTEAPQAADHALLWGGVSRGDTASTEARREQAWQLCQRYISRTVAGVFFAPLEALGPDDRTNERIVAALDHARIPVVLLDRDFLHYPKRSAHDIVGIDNRRTGYMATEHLLALGARRVAFFSFSRAPGTVDERIAGYREALHVHQRGESAELVQRLSPSDDSDVLRVFDSAKADAIVCANDRTAARVMQALLARNVRIPGDVRLVGIDDVPYAELLPIPLTTMHQPCREIGMAAMSAMIERISRPDLPVREIYLECPLVIRDSCGAKLAN